MQKNIWASIFVDFFAAICSRRDNCDQSKQIDMWCDASWDDSSLPCPAKYAVLPWMQNTYVLLADVYRTTFAAMNSVNHAWLKWRQKYLECAIVYSAAHETHAVMWANEIKKNVGRFSLFFRARLFFVIDFDLSVKMYQRVGWVLKNTLVCTYACILLLLFVYGTLEYLPLIWLMYNMVW